MREGRGRGTGWGIGSDHLLTTGGGVMHFFHLSPPVEGSKFVTPFLRVKRWQTFLERFLSFLMFFFSPIFVYFCSILFFIFSRSLLGSILSSQADFPTPENLYFPQEILTLLKNHRFRSKDGFENVLGLLLGSSWGYLGGSLGPLHRP